jgi:phosphoribosylanthranilate isomerase
MPPARVKICGLRRSQDVTAAVQAGADALGFVFVPQSQRFIEPGDAVELCRHVPPFISRVGLFLDQEAEYVWQVLQRVPLSLLQFHGRENAAYCRQFGRPYIKAVSLDSDNAVAAAELAYEDAVGILVDSHQPGGLGGTGQRADWGRIPAIRLPMILAGGLNPDNVRSAIRAMRPWAVDVSSGVESAPGIKDGDAIRRFIKEAKCEKW